jgi:DNA adenine methylase
VSLLRYIGGKSKFARRIVPYIKIPSGGVFCDPFVGGGSVTLAVASKYEQMGIVLNDLDPEVANFWSAVINPDDDAITDLIHRIETSKPTVEQFREFQKSIPTDPIDRAYRFLFINRCARVESNGLRPLGGWEQEKGGIDSRWNGERLANEFLDAREALLGRTVVYNQDFSATLAAAETDWHLYLDPPYYTVGDTLYSIEWTDHDHVRLRDLLMNTPAKWVLSYGNHPRILELYANTTIHTLEAHHGMKKRKSDELIITPSL